MRKVGKTPRELHTTQQGSAYTISQGHNCLNVINTVSLKTKVKFKHSALNYPSGLKTEMLFVARG